MRKRILAILLAVLIAAAMLPTAALAGKADGYCSDWARTWVNQADELGLIPDCLDAVNFTKQITRKEFAAVAVKIYEALSGKKAAAAEKNPFTDCSDAEVLKAVAIGITNGTAADTFSPDVVLNREQLATMLTRIYKKVALDGWTLATDGNYTAQFRAMFTMPSTFADDEMISDFAKDSVYFMKASGIINGVGENRFAPKPEYPEDEETGYGLATREQALKIAVGMVTELGGSRVPEKPQPSAETVSLKTVTACGITADVMTVNVRNPKVRVEAAMVDKTVAARAPFSDIVARADGALAVITGNFMNGDSEGNFPVGHVMVNGELLYIGSGYSSLGITADGELRFGRPSIRVRMDPQDRDYPVWTAIGLNLKEHEQEAQFSVLYTPAFGTQFTVTCAGSVTVVSKECVKEYRTVKPEDVIAIPADGYVLWLSDTYMREFVYDFQHPEAGEPVKLEYFLYTADAEGFTIDGVTQILSGGPRLVQGGKAFTEKEEQFSGDRFTDTYSAPRTAVGATADGTLIFISTDAATVPQLREFMLSLGCVDAFNLDGGASTGLYFNGKTYRTPGRNLATTVSIYVD